MVWAAIAGAILSGISSRSAAKKASKDNNKQRAWEREQSQFEAEQGLRTLGYSAELQEYLKQKDRNTKSAGWDNFYNPEGKPGRAPAVAPNIQDYLAKLPPQG